ncbi:hypothetical protein BDQ17DRAFT_1425164 [Cyathus striatus]|nr:hypothetical protein BDQ17DRAFT_1425164 [Cyathus striatus]
MPWEQIIHFKSWDNKFEEEEFFDLFNAMPNLTSLEIHGRTFNCNRNVILPSLQLLIMNENTHGTWESEPKRIFNIITAPHLKSLVLTCGYFAAFSVTEFLNRSGCLITDLTLTKAHLDEDLSGMASKQLQNLKKLCLHKTTRFQWLARYSMQDSSHGIFDLFPELETLEVPAVLGHELGCLLAMLKIRLRHIQQHAADIEGGQKYFT